MTDIQILNYVIGALVIVYNGLILFFMFYLRDHHNEVWASFSGKGAFALTGPIDSYRFVRTGLYALFQSGYRTLNDWHVTAYVFAIRALLLALIPLMLIYVHLKNGVA
jgi:hypothetical protein